jgi:uncharacterized protein YkwD
MRARQGLWRSVPIVLALGLLGVLSPAAQAQATCVVSAADQVIDSEEHKVLELINQHRAANGRAALAGHPDMTRAAAWMSRDMATRNLLPGNHVDSLGRDIQTRFTACAATYVWWGENIYAGTTGLAQDAFDWWKNSGPHNTNMLNSNFTTIGIARAYDANSTYKYWWTTTFSDSRRDPIANFDNDLDSEISVYRPSTSQWFIEGSPPVSFGASGDVPVPGDYDGDGDADIAVFRPSNGGWFIKDQATVFLGGAVGDIPVPADYDGDGDTDPAVFRPSVGGWYINGVTSPVFHGRSGDIPVPADYNGQGGIDIAIFRPSVGGWYVNGGSTVFHGLNGDIPVPANYDADRPDEIAVFRPSVGGWYIQGSAPVFHGLSGDFPAPGNLDADAAADIAVFRRIVGGWYIQGGTTTFYGLPGDVPLLLPNHIQRFFTFSGA